MAATSEESAGTAGPGAQAAVARLLCEAGPLLAQDPPGAPAVRWKLTEPERQLDANLVRLLPGERVGTHAEPDLDVLLCVVSGGGELTTPEGRQPLAPGALVWLPHGSARSLAAGPEGLGYLTVHRRRPGMRIGRRPGAEADPPPDAAADRRAGPAASPPPL